jgi:glycosidase
MTVLILGRTTLRLCTGGFWLCRGSVRHPGKAVDWGPWAIVKGEFGGKGGADSGEGYVPAPDIDHKNETVRQGYKDWIKWLQSELGYESLRFDFVKVPPPP